MNMYVLPIILSRDRNFTYSEENPLNFFPGNSPILSYHICDLYHYRVMFTVELDKKEIIQYICFVSSFFYSTESF